jgi:ribose transport system ATP-binding protein
VTSAATASSPLLEAQNISKSFPGVQALDKVNLSLRGAEVLAVVGENGAGKSTLMKVLAGVVAPDDGRILIDGHPVQIASVQDAERHGIVLIHQELNLADNLDVAGNVFLGREPTWAGPLRFIDRRRLHAETRQLTARLGWDCPTHIRVSDLSPGQQQMVEIARALSLRSRIVIMDEPTSSLTQHETQRLFQVIRELKRAGVGVLYISHRLREVEEIADRVTVLRDGRNSGELEGAAIRHVQIVRLMVGRDLKQFFHRDHAGGQASARRHTTLRVERARWSTQLGQPVSFGLAAGEIVGMAGLVGAGRTELAEALFGIRRLVDGELYVDGKRLRPRNPAEAIAAGILLVPEDRRLQGLVLSASVRHNIGLPNLDRLSWLRLVARRREEALAQQQCRQLNIRTPDTEKTVGLLSGGNQQKVVLGKWLARTPRVLILDEPTRGVDVGAKTEIYALMDRLASQGIAILMISSDLEEVLGMSDRVLVMHQGAIAGELSRAKMTEEAIMLLATGGKRSA